MANAHTFDAGDMSCGDGFALEFRRRMEQVGVGEVVTTIVRDPSAKSDLPPLARMMGHSVESVSERPDGSLVFRVARGR